MLKTQRHPETVTAVAANLFFLDIDCPPRDVHVAANRIPNFTQLGFYWTLKITESGCGNVNQEKKEETEEEEKEEEEKDDNISLSPIFLVPVYPNCTKFDIHIPSMNTLTLF